MSEDLDVSARADGPAVAPAPAVPPAPAEVQDAALGELQRRHRVVADEYARLTAILEAAGRVPRELDATSDLSAASALALAPHDVAALGDWERASQGPLVRGASSSPDPQRVVHLGSERHPPRPSRGRALAVGASSAGVGAVVATAIILLMSGRWAQEPAPEAALIAPGPQAVASEQAPPVAAPLPEQPATSVSPALDAVVVRARTAVGMDEGTAALARRLPALTDLDGEARAEEAADIYGLAVTEARDDPSGVAAEIVDALESEVALNGVLALAARRPEVVGPGMGPLLADLGTLPTLPAEDQQAAAQQILDSVVQGVGAETISGPYCNSIAYALRPYGAVPPT